MDSRCPGDHATIVGMNITKPRISDSETALTAFACLKNSTQAADSPRPAFPKSSASTALKS